MRAARKAESSTTQPEQPARPRAVSTAERSPKLKAGRSERRDRVRCEVQIDIEGESGQDSFSGVTRDLSQAGAFVATKLELPVGTLVHLQLHLPKHAESFRCVGEVRWQRAGDPSTEEPPGLGLRFVLLEPDARRAVQLFLAERTPALLDD